MVVFLVGLGRSPSQFLFRPTYRPEMLFFQPNKRSVHHASPAGYPRESALVEACDDVATAFSQVASVVGFHKILHESERIPSFVGHVGLESQRSFVLATGAQDWLGQLSDGL